MPAACTAPGSSIHGVLHRMSLSDTETLCVAEQCDMHRVDVTARLYTGHEIDCFVYMDQDRAATTDPECIREWSPTPTGMGKSSEERLPSERYINIMTEGAAHFGVNPQYIEKLSAHSKQPRTKVEDFTKIQMPEGLLATWTQEEYEQNSDGHDEESYHLNVNGKVLKASSGRFYTRMLSGKVCTVV